MDIVVRCDGSGEELRIREVNITAGDRVEVRVDFCPGCEADLTTDLDAGLDKIQELTSQVEELEAEIENLRQRKE